MEVLVLCIAALGHDLGHFALNNKFLINSNHPIVQKHGKESALEHHHLNEITEVLEVRALFSLARTPFAFVMPPWVAS